MYRLIYNLMEKSIDKCKGKIYICEDACWVSAVCGGHVSMWGIEHNRMFASVHIRQN